MKMKRAVALLVCLSMILCFMPVSAGAEDETPEIGTEVTSIREENVKHFSLGNGNYQAVAYSHPIHEKDEDGNWQDIDFSMDLTRQNGTRVYANEAGGTAFAASYVANEPIMTLGDEGSSISMTLVTDTPSTSTWSLFGSSVAAEVTGAEVDIQTLEDAQNASFSNTLLYEEVMPGIDLEYIVDPWCVKENIIVNQPGESYFYRFLLEIDGMYPVMQEDGSILIYSEETDEPEYEIPAPYMYDAEGEESFDVFYNIETTNGDYYLTVFADSNWINAEDRVFPVTIDPTYADYQDVTMDTYINGDAANETRGAYTFLYVGENEKAYIYMPTPELPEGALLYGAELSVWYYYFDKVSTGYVDVTAHQVDGMAWSDGTLTWNVAENYSNNYGLSSTKLGEKIRMYGNIGAYKGTPQKADFDITLAVQDWIDNSGTNYGVGSNYGIGLDYDADSSANRSVRLHSTESTASYRPQMTYQYNAVDSDHEHTYTATNQPTATTHPHKTMWECECGATKNTYPLLAMCSECRANERIATETVCYTKVFYYIDGDAGLGTIVPAPIECYITYTNYYDYPVSMVYNYPSFVTFGSIVDSYTPGSSIYPPVNCISSKVVTYYSSLDVELWQQTMQWNLDNNAIPYNTLIAYTLNKKPGYIVTGATFAMMTGGTSYNIDITTYFE